MMNKQTKNINNVKSIVLCGGGTAGHVLPAIALLPLLKKHFGNIVFIGGKQGIEKNIALSAGLDYYGVNSAKLCRSFSFKNAAIPFKLISGISEASKILKQLKPSVVFSKGGYVALPVVIAAYLNKIPVIAHESDISPGVANKISSKFCRAVCTSFSGCAKMFKNGIFTGSPIREELFTGNKESIYSKYGISDSKPLLLIIGGSSGAKYINDTVRECLKTLLNIFYIIHITGKGNIIDFDNKDYIQIEFTEQIADIFSAADYIISRAGSNTLFEIVSLKKPALIIPLPKGVSRGDQVENAVYFEEKGCVMYKQQSSIDKTTLPKYLAELESVKHKLIENMVKLDTRKGNENILNVILQNIKS